MYFETHVVGLVDVSTGDSAPVGLLHIARGSTVRSVRRGVCSWEWAS